MSVDYTFSRTNSFRADLTLSSTTRRLVKVVFVPGATESQDMIALTVDNGASLIFLQRSLAGTFDNSLGEYVYSNSNFGGSIDDFDFVKGPSINQDQIAIVGGDNFVYLIQRDSGGLFLNALTIESIDLGANELNKSVTFILNTSTSNDDELAVVSGPTNITNLKFLQRNSSTNIFDSSSGVRASATIATVNSPSSTLTWAPNPEDLTKDQLFFSRPAGNSGTVMFQRNGTSTFDLSFSDYNTNVFNTEKGFYIPGETTDKDQIVFVRNANNGFVRFHQRQAGGVFDATSFSVSGLAGGGAGRRAAFFKHPLDRSLDAIIFGTNQESLTAIVRNESTNIFDSSSFQYALDVSTINNPIADPFYVYLLPASSISDIEFFVSGSSSETYVKRLSATEFDINLNSAQTLQFQEELGSGTEIASIAEGLRVKQASTIFVFDAHASIGGDLGKFNYIRNGNTDFVFDGQLDLEAELSGDFQLTTTRVLNLSAATITPRVENIILNATSTLVLNGDTLAAINLETYTFASGATIDNAGAPDVTVTVASDPGIVTTSSGGGAVIIVAPQTTLSFTGIPAGTNGSIRQGSKILSQQTNIITGLFSYTYNIAGELVTYKFTNPGLETIEESLELAAVDQSIPLTFVTEESYEA